MIEKQKVVIDQLKNKLQVEDFEHFDTLRSVLFVTLSLGLALFYSVLGN